VSHGLILRTYGARDGALHLRARFTDGTGGAGGPGGPGAHFFFVVDAQDSRTNFFFYKERSSFFKKTVLYKKLNRIPLGHILRGPKVPKSYAPQTKIPQGPLRPS
jgi:hypothetical protein